MILFEVDPELEHLQGGEELIRNALLKALSTAWDLLSSRLHFNLIYSMTTRVNVLIEAEGWYVRF